LSADVRQTIVRACRVLERIGQGDLIWGHVSIRDEEGRGLWLKGARLGFDEVAEGDVILLSWDGEVVEGTAQRHVEYAIHTEIMRVRTDVNAVVHTHPLHSIAFMATHRPLRALSHEGAQFVPPELPRFVETGELVTQPVHGVALAAALGDRSAILMPCHGITTVGPELGAAVGAAYHLDRACHIDLLAGPDAYGTDDEAAVRKRTRANRRFLNAWEYLERRYGDA
jgi:L-fuculose-phosphate aldolase